MDTTIADLIAQEDMDEFANRLAELLREPADHGLTLAAIASNDAELKQRLCRACTIYFGCLTGMHDTGLLPLLQLAEDIDAREGFEHLFLWFTENRIEGADLWPVPEDERNDRLPIVKRALHAIAMLQPRNDTRMINYWLQMWYEPDYKLYHGEAYLGFIVGDPMFAASELRTFMYIGLPETKELLHIFLGLPESKEYLLKAIERGRSYEADWAIAAAKQLNLP